MATVQAPPSSTNGHTPGTLDAGRLSEGIAWERQFSPTDDPYETIELEVCDIVLKNAMTDEIVHQDLGVTFPRFWDQNARDITSQHYLRGALGSPEREKSVTQMIDRVVDTIVRWAMVGRPEVERPLFTGPLFRDEASAQAFAADLKYLIITQVVNFNSPVWYNVGVEGVPQQPSACFILEVEDTMQSILGWYVEEGTIFKGGSGAGTNLSRVRSSYEGLSKGGWASGPVSYMAGADASAGTMKSGGRSRRAAKMVVLNDDHPDILVQANGAPGFITTKARAEEINRTLLNAGFDVAVDSGIDSVHVQFQNANNSVRFSNEFMETLLADGEWQTRARSERVLKELPRYRARDLWMETAKAAWACADPGVQYDSTINFWHTTPAAGRINASNPCSEYMHLDNSPCNLAASNLLKFLNDDGSWESERFQQTVEILAIAQTILAVFGDYPTEKVRDIAVGFRQIGQGYTNLGAMLMTNGLAYDSDAGRAWSAAVTSLMEASITRTSAKIARVWGAYPGSGPEHPGWEHPDNRRAHLRIVNLRREYSKAISKPTTAKGRKLSISFGEEAHIDIFHKEVVGGGEPVAADPHLASVCQAAVSAWNEAIKQGEEVGYANAHMSVLAPMGTNGYMMGNDTTGIEPALSLVVRKKKVSGDWMDLVNQSVRPALRKLGYGDAEQEEIVAYVDLHNTVVGAPHLDEKDYSVFDTSFGGSGGTRFISIAGHVLMMAAAQPFISGAISKTGNMPEEATVDDVDAAYFDSWRYGLKAMAIYRNNCKATQPMSAAEKEALAGPPPTTRHKLPRKTQGGRIKLRIVDPTMGEFELYAFYSTYPDGSFGEIFEIAGAEGTLVNGLLAWAAKQISVGVQHGVPLKSVIKMGLNMNFPPQSNLISPQDSDFTSCTSVADLLSRELALEFLPTEDRHELGIYTRRERAEMVSGTGYGEVSDPSDTEEDSVESTSPSSNGAAVLQGQVKMCFKCSIPMNPTGNCYSCPQCGGTTGCS